MYDDFTPCITPKRLCFSRLPTYHNLFSCIYIYIYMTIYTYIIYKHRIYHMYIIYIYIYRLGVAKYIDIYIYIIDIHGCTYILHFTFMPTRINWYQPTETRRVHIGKGLCTCWILGSKTGYPQITHFNRFSWKT